MKLTEKKALDLTEELWGYLKEKGAKTKGAWPKWEEYGEIDADCFLCEYNGRKSDESGHRICERCPYYKAYGYCHYPGTPFTNWSFASNKEERKKYASLFLEQLKAIRRG